MKRQIIIYAIIAVILIVVLYFGLKKFGLIRTKEQKQTAKETEKIKLEKKVVKTSINKSQYFKPSFYKDRPTGELISPIEANQYAETIHEGFNIHFYNILGDLNIDEEEIYGAFRALTYKAQVSQIAEAYNKKFKSDLAGDLLIHMNKGQMQIVYQITDSLN